MSTDTKQLLTQAGIECDYISMDREVEPYLNFRDVVVDKRWVCHSIPMLIFELVNLEHDKEKQKVDHPGKIVEIQFLPDGDSHEVVLMGSKDMADAVSASVYGLLDACDGLPMDKDVMVRAMAKVLKKQTDPRDDPMWFMDRDKAFGSLDEEHVLIDSNQRYWVWGKAAHQSEPILRGPFSTNPLGTKPIEVEDPTSFDPTVHVEKAIPDERQAKFADIVKKIGRQYRR